MSYATIPLPLMENNQRNNDFMLIALLLSIALHSTVIGFLPGFGKPSALVEQLLTVDLVTPEPPPPPPIKEPEPPKPEPKPVLPPKPVTPPVPRPITPEPPAITPTPQLEAPPPVAETPKLAEPPPVIAVEQKSAEPPPTFTAPTPAPVTSPVIDDAEEDPDGFGRAMTGEFKKNVKYPQVAIMRGWEGVVKVTLHIDAEGNVTDITIKQKSGKDTLDEAALKTARKTRLLPIPPARRGKPFTLTVPISYSLKNP